MQNLKNMEIFVDDQNFQKVKEESIKALLSDHNVLKIIHKYHLQKEDIENNWADFLSYQEDLLECVGCSSLANCSKVSKGMQYNLSYENKECYLSLTPCQFGKEQFENQEVLQRIPLKNVDERILLTKTSDIPKVLNNSNKQLVSSLTEFIREPKEKGYYLYGPAGTGKSMVLGWAIRNLAKQGHLCGYIHFPTFLIDLKNSFGEEGIYKNIEFMKNLDYLVIDDIGGENPTPWSRDEILSSILAYRGQSNKATFFTSRYPLKVLGDVYVLKKGDSIRVERVIERIRTVSEEIELK